MHPATVMLLLMPENGIDLFSEYILDLFWASFQYCFPAFSLHFYYTIFIAFVDTS